MCGWNDDRLKGGKFDVVMSKMALIEYCQKGTNVLHKHSSFVFAFSKNAHLFYNNGLCGPEMTQVMTYADKEIKAKSESLQTKTLFSGCF